MTKFGKMLCMTMAIVLSGFSLVWAGGSGDKSKGAVTTLPPGGKSLDQFTLNYFDFNEDPASAPSNTKNFYANVEKLFKTLYPNAKLVLSGVQAGLDGLDILLLPSLLIM